MSELLRISYLFAPLVVGMIFHGFCIRFGWLASLARPIDRGATFRGRPLFGPNKTWRGIVAVGLGAAVALALQARWLHGVPSLRALELVDYSTLPALALGFAFGAAAMASELPNSFLKRQLGIGAGERSVGVREAVFYVVDQVDMLVGAWLVLSLVVPVTAWRVALSVVLFIVIHQVLSTLGHALGMRRSAR